MAETHVCYKTLFCLTTLPKGRDLISTVLRQWWKKHKGMGGNQFDWTPP